MNLKLGYNPWSLTFILYFSIPEVSRSSSRTRQERKKEGKKKN